MDYNTAVSCLFGWKAPPQRISDLYHFGTLLGKTARAIVTVLVRKSDLARFAGKFIAKAGLHHYHWCAQEPGLLEEANTMARLKHPNLLSLEDYCHNEFWCVLVVELFGVPWASERNGSKDHASVPRDLFSMLDRFHALSESVARHIIRQLLSALLYMHSCSVYHLDIKDENVLVNDAFTVKLIDFGSAEHIDACAPLTLMRGTQQYTAPEMLLDQPSFGPSCDVFALGVLLYTMVAGTVPFATPTATVMTVRPEQRQRQWCVQDAQPGDHGRGLLFPRHMSASLCHLLGRMLRGTARFRATLQEIQEHAWFQLG